MWLLVRMDFVLSEFMILNLLLWTKDKFKKRKTGENKRIVGNDKNIACCHESIISMVYVHHSHSGHCNINKRKCYKFIKICSIWQIITSAQDQRSLYKHNRIYIMKFQRPQTNNWNADYMNLNRRFVHFSVFCTESLLHNIISRGISPYIMFSIQMLLKPYRKQLNPFHFGRIE